MKVGRIDRDCVVRVYGLVHDVSVLRLLGTGTSIRYHIDMDITREAFTPR